ncbi:MAG: L-aspartate oxidase [Actinobacteria bacterium]|nr:L-aspartate oxidase [Actinomycetota bacterium]MBM3697315.1 L-aspartate oxidase [Actinomycetota bacterium]
MTSIRRKTTRSTPIVVVGSGLAGLSAAVRIAAGRDVVIITKGTLGEGSTSWAQGGIAAALGPGDTVHAHADDTIHAAAGLGDSVAASALCADAPGVIADLAALGVGFDIDHGRIALAREGAHSLPRVAHAGGDATGRHVIDALTLRVRRNERITVMEHRRVDDLRVDDHGVHGVLLAGGHVIDASAVLLATGGSGHLFARTTNPMGATADGPALARRAGAALADMEMVQFHPTALAAGASPLALVSEAVRGAGGMLYDCHGEPVMAGVHPMGDLGPRDVVARAVFRRAHDTGHDVVMSLAHLDPDRVRARFPEVAALCAAYGIDLARDPVPVTPAAHYAMGGVLTDLRGRTTVPGLWAVGECACTGLHGANRLASNGLLEAAALGRRAADDVAAGGGTPAPGPRTEPRAFLAGDADGAAVNEAVGRIMWQGCGLERDAQGLGDAVAALDALPRPADAQAAGLLDIARVTALAALAREESRGAHFRTDFPEPDPSQAHRTCWAADTPTAMPSIDLTEVA